MPRRGKIAKRDVLEDPIYGSKLVTRLINNVMVDGKKGVAQKIVYGAFDIVAEKTGNVPGGYGQRNACSGSKGSPYGRCHIPGSDGSSSGTPSDTGSALDHQVFQTAERKDNEGTPGRRNPRCAEQHRRCLQKA